MSEPLLNRKRCQQGYQIEHICTDPSCPGDINRRKLEMFGELVAALEDSPYPDAFAALLARAKELG